MKTLYFANSNTFGPYMSGKTYSEGFARVAQTSADEVLLDRVAAGEHSNLIAHLPKREASCTNGVVSLKGN